MGMYTRVYITLSKCLNSDTYQNCQHLEESLRDQLIECFRELVPSFRFQIVLLYLAFCDFSHLDRKGKLGKWQEGGAVLKKWFIYCHPLFRVEMDSNESSPHLRFWNIELNLSFLEGTQKVEMLAQLHVTGKVSKIHLTGWVSLLTS